MTSLFLAPAPVASLAGAQLRAPALLFVKFAANPLGLLVPTMCPGPRTSLKGGS